MSLHDVDELLHRWTSLPLEERLEMARTVIDRYDADFDALNRRRAALGALEILLTGVAQNTTDAGELAVLVGEAWCRMVDADVEYDLPRGLQLIERSKRAAEMLATHERRSTCAPFATYVLARWHDAAGRLNFRCGEMQDAAKLFGSAVLLAQDDQARCIDDLRSNLRRAEHDAAKQVGDKVNDGELRRKFEELLEEAEGTVQGPRVGLDLGVLRDELLPSAAIWWTDGTNLPAFPTRPHDAAWDHVTRERLRGLSNVEHNLSIVLKTLGEETLGASREHSRRSAIYAYAIADGYRFAQALRHMADLVENRDVLREAMCKRLEMLPWPRGRLIAKQHLGRYLTATGRLGEAQQLLDTLLTEISRQQEARGGDLGVDVDMLRYTAKDYRDAGAPVEDAERHELKAARSMRRVVKAALYRRGFKNHVLPLYARAIERRTVPLLLEGNDLDASPRLLHSQEAIEDLLGLVEETTARELLDLLATRRPAGPPQVFAGPSRTRPAEPMDAAPTALNAEAPLANAATRGGASTRDGLRDDPGDRRTLVALLRRDRERFEQAESERTAATGEIDPEVAQALRRLTAQANGPTIVRYFTYQPVRRGPGAAERSGEEAPHVAVAVLRGGIIRAFRALADESQQPLTLKTLGRRPVGLLPTRGDAAWLWKTFLAPIWDEVRGDGAIAQLVIIPAPGMFALPLHVALIPRSEWPRDPKPALSDAVAEAPLGVVTPLCFTVSATAFVTRQRHLLRTQPFDRDDDLCALVPSYRDHDRCFWPGELKDVAWRPERFHLAGQAVDGAPGGPRAKGDRDGLNLLLEQHAEVFVFAGHGTSVQIDGIDAEVALELDEGARGPEFLTQYALLSGPRLRHNRWTLLNACVSGTAADEAARAEVSGFLKAFIAAGAGALTVTLWPVDNEAIVHVAGALLRDAARATASGSSVDIVARLREIQCALYGAWHARQARERRPSSMKKASSAEHEKHDARQSLTAPGGMAEPTRVSRSLQACPMVLYL